MARPNNAQAIGAHIEGMRAAKAKFQALPVVVRERTLAVNTATAQAVALGAQQRVLASPSIHTGMLLRSIKWSVSQTNGSAKVGVTSGSTVMTIAGKRRRVKGIVVAGRGGSALTSQGARLIRPSRYAHLVEFGSVQMPAEPFMMPAASSQKDLHLRRWREAGRQIERDLRTGGGRI